MTRRLILAILGTTIAAIVLAGLGTLVLAGARARASTEKDLRTESKELANGLARIERPATNTALRQTLVRTVARALKVEDVSVMNFGPAGRTGDTPPAGVSLNDLRVDRLLAGETVSGSHGNLVYAATASPVDSGHLAVVITRKAQTGLAAASRWFLIAAIVAVAVGAIVAITLGRRLVKPVREADAAAHRIAAGELSTRLPEPRPGATDELSDLARSINAMAASLERSKTLEQQFLLSISHDLRTPLTSIRGYAEAITDGATKDPQWAASVILSESRRLERLVHDLLDLAKLQSTGFSLHLQPLDLSAIVRAAAEGFEPDAAARNVALHIDAPAPITVNADGDRLAQVVANLVENSLKYARTTITVTTGHDGPTATLSVDDDGPGIAPGDLPHVFERLYVARHEPARRESGSGLGLAIVRELVDAMHGTVEASASPTGGARITVRMPPPPAPDVLGRSSASYGGERPDSPDEAVRPT
jgi:two-component system sensor histidine kinase BaeS